MYTDDHFVSVKVAGCCSQKWRLVDMVVTPEALYWGSDDDQQSPGIYRYDVRSGALERQSDLDNPSYHAALLSNGTMVVSTTYEPGSLYTKSAQPPAATSLWASRDGRRWKKILTRSADAEEVSLGLRGQLQIPHGDPLPAIFVTPWHTERDEFATLRIRTAALP
jgi:hypothetical protein